MEEEEITYAKLSIESAHGGWVVTEKGNETRVFVRWDAVISHIKQKLTS